MKPLFVKIDRAKKQALFSGPGTFEVKDRLKQLGKARWQPVDKAWLVGNFSLSDEELCQLFPQAEIDAVEELVERKTEKENLELPSGYSVSSLMRSFSATLSSAFPGVIHVYGVLSSVKRYGERIYMDLSDPDHPDQQINCVIWGAEKKLTAELTKAGFKLEENLQVMFAVRVSLNEKRGSISLSVQKIISEYTIAKLAAQRELTNKQLKKEGIFSNNKQLSLPLLPKRLLVLTSSGGTVIHDFRASLDESEFGFELSWLPVPVQGLEAKAPLVSAIQFAGKQTQYDAVLLFRGGGSAADLQLFNEYEVAKAICLAKVPFLVAVGHQEDQSSAQDVSNMSFGVPKDIGHFFKDLIYELRENFSQFLADISSMSNELVDESWQTIAEVKEDISRSVEAVMNSYLSNLAAYGRLIPSQGEGLTKAAYIKLSGQGERLVDRTKFLVDRKERRINEKASRISSSSTQFFQKKLESLHFMQRYFSEVSPDTQLKRGFTMVKQKGAENYVLSASELQNSQEIEITFHDKSIGAVIKD